MIIIQATLKDWHLNDELNFVIGTIYNSINHKEYPEGERYTIMKVTCIQYPETDQYGPAHIIATTPLGNHFRLNLKDMK